MTDQTTGSVPDKAGAAEDAKVAARLQSFVATNGGSGTAVVSYLGRRGARIVAVSADGPFTDAVVSGVERAEAICEAAGLPVKAWDRELSAAVTVSASDRVRMAGTGR